MISVRGLRRAIIHWDEHVIAINKWRNLAVQDAFDSKKSLVQNLGMLKSVAPEFKGDQPRLIHRLDQTTTGVLLIGRNPNVTGRISKMFEKGLVKKEYVGLCHDLREGNDANKRGTWVTTHPIDGKEMRTNFEVVYSIKGIALVHFYPQTGRHHQIRIQASTNLLPILGDKRYALENHAMYRTQRQRVQKLIAREEPGHGVLAHLHAHKLTLPSYFFEGTLEEDQQHGTSGDLEICAPIPNHWHVSLNALFKGQSQKILANLSCK
eukprot:m.10448 g.10448  ORF g.10448 m.10448 type:complete len:265 (-) comp3673_c0_seq1:307-1101(-)